MKKYFIGTSGWHYNHWKQAFYPDGVNSNHFLEYYSQHFDTVEINNTFYRLPTQKMIQQWCDTTPKGFTFSIKASGYITHRKRLIDVADSLNQFLKMAELFKEKLGAILFLIPPSFQINVDRLKSFLELIPSSLLCTFEFRNSTWWTEEIFELLSQHQCALCLHDFNNMQPPLVLTSNKLCYFRLHGPEAAYQGLYPKNQIQALAHSMKEKLKKTKKVFCYFDNDEEAHAIKNAAFLNELMFK